jgi:hypothetical protein
MVLCLLIVLLLGVMPALLLLLGWGVKRYTTKAAARTGWPVPRTDLSDAPDQDAPARARA